MSLTRVQGSNFNSNTLTISEHLLTINKGNISNRDIGLIFDRSTSSQSNVALIWQASTSNFVLGYTNQSYTNNTNISVTSNADLTVANLNVSNGISINGNFGTAGYILQSTGTGVQWVSNPSSSVNINLTGNLIADSIYANIIGNSNSIIYGTLSANTVANIDFSHISNLTVTGTLNAGIVQSAIIGNVGATFIGNGSQITGITGSQITTAVANAITAQYVTGLTSANVDTALGYIPLDSNGSAISSGTAQYVTQATQSNITQVGTLTNLTVAGTINANTVQAQTIGNVGATLIGNGSQITGIIGSQVVGPVTTAIYVTGLTNSNVTTALGYVPIDSNATINTEYVIQGIQSNITQVGTLTNLTVSGTINANAMQAATIGNIGASFVGNGSQITGITGSQIVGPVTDAVTAQYVTGLTAANVDTALGYVPLNSNSSAVSAGTAQYVTQATQSNITAVGTLTNLTVAGTINANTVQAQTIGNIGATFIGNGSQITGITGSQVSNITGSQIVGAVTTAQYVTGLTSGNVTTALGYVPLNSNASINAQYVIQPIQSNITAVGTLTNLTVSGTINANTVQAQTIGNIGAAFIGNGSQLTNLTGGQVTGTVANATTAQYVTGLTSGNVTTALGYVPINSNSTIATAGTAQYVTQAIQSNITQVGTLTNLTVAGTINANTVQAQTIGNIGASFIGNGSQITGITGSQVVGTVANATNAVTAQYVTGLTAANVDTALGYIPLNSNGTAISSGTAQYVTQATQSNITQVGTLTNLVVSGTINANTVQAQTIGNIGARLIGNGSQLTDLTGSQVVGAVTNAITAEYVTNLTAANVDTALGYVPLDSNATITTAGTAQYVTQGIQSNITQVGTLTNLIVSGTINANTVQAQTIGNIGATLIGNGSQITGITGGQITGTVANATNAVTAEYVTGLTSSNVTTALTYVPLDSNAAAIAANTIISPIQSNITQVGTLTNLVVSGTINAGTVQAATIGNIGATFIGNGSSITGLTGSQIGNITGSQIIGAVTLAVTAQSVTGLSSANVTTALGYVPLNSNSSVATAGTAQYVIQPIQSNITQVGTLTNLYVSGTINTGTVEAAVIGNIGATIIGNGSQLTGITGSQVVGAVATAVTAEYVTGLTAANVDTALGYVPLDSNATVGTAGTAQYVTQAIQSNITQVGILSNLIVAGTIESGVVQAAVIGNIGATLIGNGSQITGITGSQITGTVTSAVTAQYVTGLTAANVDTALGYVPLDSNATVGTANLAQYVTQAIQSNITAVGTLSNLTVAGTINANTVQATTIGNIGATLVGNGSQLTGITGSQVTGTVANATNAVTAVYVTGLTSGNITTALGYTPLDANTGSGTANLAQYVTQPIQSNITQVGTLTNLTVSGTIEGNVIQAATIGNIGATFIGNGSQLTGITGSQIVGSVTNAVTAQYVTGLTAANVDTALGYVPLNSNSSAVSAGTALYVVGPTQSNITALGTLTSLYVSGTINANTVQASTIGNIGATFIGNGSQLTGITGSQLVGPVTTATYVTNLTSSNVTTALGYTPLDANAVSGTANLAQYVTQPIQSNITQVGTLSNLTVAGTINANTVQAQTIGNIGATFIGNGRQLTGLIGSQISGAVTNAVTAQYVTGLTAANVDTALGYVPLDSNASAVSAGTAQYVTQAIQSNITQVGTLSSLSVGGTINAVTVQAATIGNTGAVLAGASLTTDGDVTIGGNLRVNGSTVTINREIVNQVEIVGGNLIANSNAISTSTTTGALQVLGGVGITGAVFVGGVLSGLAVSAATIGNAGAQITGNGSGLISITGANVTGTVANATYAITANTANYATTSVSSGTAQYVTGNTQSNITSVGTLTGLTLSGTMYATSIQSQVFGNLGATFSGATFTATGGFQGPLNGTLGSSGANTAVVTTLSANGNATVSALTVNNSATIGTTLSVAGNITAGNIIAGGVRSTTSGTAPVNPVVGDMWFDSTNYALLRWTYDGSNSFWLQLG